MAHSITFKQLQADDTFDFVSPNRMLNSFYYPCRKVSARKYTDGRYDYTVGSVNCTVYHVNKVIVDVRKG